MKKIVLIVFLFLFAGCFKTEEEKVQENIDKVLTHLKKRYGEEFYISSPFGGRYTSSDALRVMVKPIRYKGTPKEYDEYYEDYAYLEKNGKTGDGFGTVYLKESAEKFFKPKLKELFGENILIAVYPEGHYKKIDFKEEMTRRKALYKDDPEGEYYPLTGGIYIFGRVESEEDREKYRRGIYEFIQYLKQEGMFEYTDIEIRVLDERILSRGYNENYEDQATIESFGDYYEREKREKIYGKYTQDFKETPQEYKNKVLDNKIKSLMNKEKSLLYIRIQSPKIAKQLNEPIIDYKKISNIRFNLGMYDDDWKFKKKEA